MATFSGRGDGTGVKNPRLKSPFPDIEPRFGGAFFYIDADALYAFKSRGFGGEIGIVCSERLRAGYTTAYPALITAFPVDLLTPSHYVHFH